MTEMFAGFGIFCSIIICVVIVGVTFKLMFIRFRHWRKHNCKFKCLCKHTYEIKWIDAHYDMMITCKACGKTKKLHFSSESLEVFGFKFEI